jgi:hypothetical protein
VEFGFFMIVPEFGFVMIVPEFGFVMTVPKDWNGSALAKELLSVFILPRRPAVSSLNTTVYLDLSAFSFSPISFLATSPRSVFLCSKYAPARYKDITSINQMLMCAI